MALLDKIMTSTKQTDAKELAAQKERSGSVWASGVGYGGYNEDAYYDDYCGGIAGEYKFETMDKETVLSNGFLLFVDVVKKSPENP